MTTKKGKVAAEVQGVQKPKPKRKHQMKTMSKKARDTNKAHWYSCQKLPQCAHCQSGLSHYQGHPKSQTAALKMILCYDKILLLRMLACPLCSMQVYHKM